MDEHIRQHLSPTSLQRLELFRELPLDELQHLAARLRFQRAAKGTVVCKEGDPGDAMYIIETGQVKVVSDVETQRLTLATLGPGNQFGEMSLLTGEPRSVGVVVSIDAELWVLSKEDFDAALRDHPALAIGLSRSLAQRLFASDHQRIYGVSEDVRRLIGVVSTPDETVLLAQRLAELGSHNVLLVDVIETGDECSTVDPSDPFHDVVMLQGDVARMDVPVEVSSGDFSEIVSRLLQKYTHLLVRLPDSGGPFLSQVLDLCEVVLVFGRRTSHWVLKKSLPPKKFWLTGGAFDPDYDLARAGRDRDRIARRLLGRSVGLALSSGAAHGLAHIGVLRVLEEEKIPIDLLAGTSMGSVLGSAYVAGHSADDLYRMGQEFAQLLNFRTGWRSWDFTLPRSGLLKGMGAKRWIDRWTGGKRFEDLEIPYFVVAAEVVSGRAVVFSEGSLANASRASFSMPGVFEPVLHNDDFLVDGGQVDPVPCQTLDSAGADIIIASNVIPQVEERLYRGVRQRVGPGRPPSIFEIYQSMREIMEAQIAVLKMTPYDVLIAPKVGMYGALEAQHLDLFVQRGEEAARAAVAEIKALLKPGVHKVRRVMV
jgi:NTE family protein